MDVASTLDVLPGGGGDCQAIPCGKDKMVWGNEGGACYNETGVLIEAHLGWPKQ